MYENSPTLDADYGDGLSLTTNDTANLRKAGKWARFIAIFTMVMLGIIVLFLVLSGSTMLAMMGMGDAPGMGAALVPFLVFYGLMLAFAFYMMYLQYQFGANAMAAVDQGDRSAMSESLSALSKYYKIYGIILVIYLVLMGIGLLMAIIGGAFTAFG